MKPGRQRRCRDENGGKKIEKYFLAHQTIQSREMEEKHKLFSLTIRNREKVRRQKLMMMAHIENSCWPSVYCIFFFGFLFFMISQHTHTTHTYTYTHALKERWREADQVLKVVLMLMTFHYATTGVRYPVDKLLNIFYATATHPLPPGPQHKHPSNGHPWTMQWCCYSHFIIPLLVPN